MKDYAIIHNLIILLKLPVVPISKSLTERMVLYYFAFILIGLISTILFRFSILNVIRWDFGIFIYPILVLACLFIMYSITSYIKHIYFYREYRKQITEGVRTKEISGTVKFLYNLKTVFLMLLSIYFISSFIYLLIISELLTVDHLCLLFLSLIFLLQYCYWTFSKFNYQAQISFDGNLNNKLLVIFCLAMFGYLSLYFYILGDMFHLGFKNCINKESLKPLYMFPNNNSAEAGSSTLHNSESFNNTNPENDPNNVNILRSLTDEELKYLISFSETNPSFIVDSVKENQMKAINKLLNKYIANLDKSSSPNKSSEVYVYYKNTLLNDLSYKKYFDFNTFKSTLFSGKMYDEFVIDTVRVAMELHYNTLGYNYLGLGNAFEKGLLKLIFHPIKPTVLNDGYWSMLLKSNKLSDITWFNKSQTMKLDMLIKLQERMALNYPFAHYEGMQGLDVKGKPIPLNLKKFVFLNKYLEFKTNHNNIISIHCPDNKGIFLDFKSIQSAIDCIKIQHHDHLIPNDPESNKMFLLKLLVQGWEWKIDLPLPTDIISTKIQYISADEAEEGIDSFNKTCLDRESKETGKGKGKYVD
jgi:hypothetical protein